MQRSYRAHAFVSRYAIALVALALFTAAGYQPALAAQTFITGLVTSDGAPAAGASVTASGSNLTASATTDAQGKFTLNGIPAGTYDVTAKAGGGRSAGTRVDVSSAGASVSLPLKALTEIGRTSASASRSATVRGSGTDLTLNSETLTRSPGSGSLPELLLQLPGAARGANGVVHINGDHGDINYIVDGVAIPQALNRAVGGEFDPNDISFVEVLQGAYPAQYGERFASVVNINTRVGNGPAGFTGDALGGSYGHYDSTFGYHTPVGVGSLVAALRNEQSDRALDPPNFDSPHNNGSNANQFARFTIPNGKDFVNFTLSHAYRTYQIPNDVAAGQPAQTDDNQTQDDLFANLQYRHVIGDRGSLSFGPSFKRARIRDFGDPSNDFTFGYALNAAAGGAPADCANAATNPKIVFGPATCGYSLFSDRTALDYRFNLDYANRSRVHEIKFGTLYDTTVVNKNYSIMLQPGNFLAPILAPKTPNAPYTVVDTAPNVGHTQEAYVQDSWRMGATYQLDYGVRFDAFQLASTQFADGATMFSPRIKLTRFFGPAASLYLFYGRFFTPFSFENVSPVSAQLLNLPNQRSLAAFDLKPQRDSVYEFGGHVPLGRGEFGLRVMQKNATDLIDDTQVGVTNLHQDINYQLGRIATQTGFYQVSLPRRGRFYSSITHTYAANKGCETQLLAPCFGSSTDWTPADHDQRWDVNGGVLLNDRAGGWFAGDGEYGSGLSSASCPPAAGSCKRTPHITFNAEKGFALGRGAALTLRVRNIFNDRYLVTYLNAQGTHYAPPRTLELGLRFGRP